VIVGNCNCPNINWSTMQRPVELTSRKFFEFAVSSGLTKCVLEPTTATSLLDLILVSDPLLVSNVEVTSP